MKSKISIEFNKKQLIKIFTILNKQYAKTYLLLTVIKALNFLKNEKACEIE